MASLHIALLGGFRLEQDGGGAISLSSRKGALLLARLAAPPGTPHSRESLQDLLWREADQKRAQGNLRYLLHRLRRTLPSTFADAVVCERTRVYLDASRVTVDVEQFEHLVRKGTAEALAEACALYSGDLLADLPVSEPGLEAWLLTERERLRDLAREAFWRNFQSDIWRGDTGTAIHKARRYLDIDPYCERMYQALIRLHLTLGERALAARSYQRLKEILAQDLLVEPRPEITALVEGEARDARMIPAHFNPAWVLAREDTASRDGKAAFPVPEKQSVAVLPFCNLTGDPRHDHLAKGITEDIVTNLSRFHSLLVVAGDLRARGERDLHAREVAYNLGTQYALEGAVRILAKRIRITAKLIDAVTGSHIWAERYDRTLDDILDLQDEISTNIVGSIAPRISTAEVSRVQRLRPDNVGALDMAWHAHDRAQTAIKYHNAKAGREAIVFAQRAIAMDRHCRLGYRTIAECHLLEALFAWTLSKDAGLARAQEAAEKLRSLDAGDHTAYFLLGRIAFMRKQHDLALMNLQRAIDLNPNDTNTLHHLAWLEGSSGSPETAIEHARLLLRLNPGDPDTRYQAHWNLAQAAFVAGDYRAGAEHARHSHVDMPHQIGDLGMLAACLAEGRELTQAREVIEEAVRLGPAYMKDRLRGNSYFKRETDHDRFVGALRKAAGDLHL